LGGSKTVAPFVKDVHKVITQEALQGTLSQPCIDKVIAANLSRDQGLIGFVLPFVRIEPYFDSRNHGDNNQIQPTLDRMRDYLRDAVADLSDCHSCIRSDRGLRLVGYVFHALQDLYSHSNWVETHAEVPNKEGGTVGATPQNIKLWDMVSVNVDGSVSKWPVPVTIVTGNYPYWDFGAVVASWLGAKFLYNPTGQQHGIPGQAGGMAKDYAESARGLRTNSAGEYYFELAVGAARRSTEKLWSEILAALPPCAIKHIDWCCEDADEF